MYLLCYLLTFTNQKWDTQIILVQRQWPGCYGQYFQIVKRSVPTRTSTLEVYPQAINSPETVCSLILSISKNYATTTSNGFISSIVLLTIMNNYLAMDGSFYSRTTQGSIYTLFSHYKPFIPISDAEN